MRAEPDALRQDSPDGVSFLTSVLVSFPQIGSAQLLDGGRTLSLEFFLNRPLRTAQLREFSREVKEAHDVFGSLKGLRTQLFKIQRNPLPRASGEGSFESMEEDPSDRMDSVEVLRDLASFTVEELSLLVALVEEEFGEDLLVGEDFDDQDEDDGYQEEVMHHSLERIRHASQESDLIGFRDDMRVLVYASEEAPRRREETRARR